MLWTTLAFVAITAWLVVRHVRRSALATVTGPAAEACPRCAASMTHDAPVCPSCGVPMRAFELVRAPIVAASPETVPSGPLHAIVRTDLCVGCGTCVAACPEPGAITVVDKRARVDLDRCKGHGSCAAACPVAAIVVTSGSAVQRVEVPLVDAHFQTNVPGLYVVGELGGRGLIKNAINEGKIAVEHAALSLPWAARQDGNTDVYDVVIVGSGPAGLSAALEARRANLRSVVLEQGSLSDSIAKYPRQKLLLAEPVRTPLYGDLWVADASKETLLRVWENLVRSTGIEIQTGQRVERIERRDGLFHVGTADREVRARRVVLALGRRGTPRRLGVPGEELDTVYYDIVEMEEFAGRRILVVGGGDSAVESALGLANQPGTTVTLSYRGARFERVRERNQAKLAAAIEQEKVRMLLQSRVREIHRDRVVVECQDRTEVVPCDVVIVRIGGEAPYPFLERIGIQIVRKEIPLDPAADAGTGR